MFLSMRGFIFFCMNPISDSTLAPADKTLPKHFQKESILLRQIKNMHLLSDALMDSELEVKGPIC